jgi:hypothetical protein
MYYLIATIILILVILFVVMTNIEPFYSYYPPSNCMQNVFGKTTCFPPNFYPFYNASYFWPFYPYWYSPYYYKSSYRPIKKHKVIKIKK